MSRQTRILATVAAVLVLVAMLFWAFDATLWSDSGQTSASGGSPYEASASAASLREAGWKVTDATQDAPDPNTNVRMVGYLQTSAPDREPITLEFYESPEDAQGELPQLVMQDAIVGATAIENVLAYHDVEEEEGEAEDVLAQLPSENLPGFFGQVSPENLQALQTLLRGS